MTRRCSHIPKDMRFLDVFASQFNAIDGNFYNLLYIYIFHDLAVVTNSAGAFWASPRLRINDLNACCRVSNHQHQRTGFYTTGQETLEICFHHKNCNPPNKEYHEWLMFFKNQTQLMRPVLDSNS